MRTLIAFSFLIYLSSYTQNSFANTISENLFKSPNFEVLQNSQFYASYCIYSLDEKSLISVHEIENLVSSVLPTFELVDSLQESANEYVIYQLMDPLNEFPAPDLNYLEYSSHGLSMKEKNELQEPAEAVYIMFSGYTQNAISSQIKINEVLGELIKNKNAIIYDDITYESFNRTAWNEDRIFKFTELNQDISSQVTIHIYRESEFCRAVTLGMEKFSLPDVSIQNISCHNNVSYGSLINLICQTWLENPSKSSDLFLSLDINNIVCDSLREQLRSSTIENAKLKGNVTLKYVEPQEGDAYNTQLEIVFVAEKNSSVQEKQDLLISEIFGSKDAIDYIQHDVELLRVSSEAKEKLPSLKDQFNKGLAPGYSILLKGPFKTDSGGREWMWVEVTQWNGEKITGILQNDPFDISSLKNGAIVKLMQKDIFDYMLYLPDGSYEGNKTGEVISKM